MTLRYTEDLKAQCVIDPTTGCWIWQGRCASVDGVPRLHTFDHARGEKRTMSGPLAAWNIAHQAAPLAGWLVFRACGHKLCLNPVHLREARDKKAIGLHIRRAGWRVGTATESRRRNVKLAQLASGTVPTPEDVVLAIRAADPSVTCQHLAEVHGIARQTVSRIRLGKSHRDLLPATNTPAGVAA